MYTIRFLTHVGTRQIQFIIWFRYGVPVCVLLRSGSLSRGLAADTLKDLARRRCAGGVSSASSAPSAAPAPPPAPPAPPSRAHQRSLPRPDPQPTSQYYYGTLVMPCTTYRLNLIRYRYTIDNMIITQFTRKSLDDLKSLLLSNSIELTLFDY